MDSHPPSGFLPHDLRAAGWRLPVLPAVAAAVVVACGGSKGGTTPVGVPASIVAQAGGGETVPVGTAVATPPAVKVSDVDGNGLPGVRVTFAVTAGVEAYSLSGR
jgi:hypothetical protein